MASYPYQTPGPAEVGQLYQECLAAGLPVTAVNGGAMGSSIATEETSRELDAAEKTTLDGVVAAHAPPTKDARRRDQALAMYDDPDSPASLVELSGEYGLLDLINVLQAHAGINQTGKAQLRNAVRAIIKPGGTP